MATFQPREIKTIFEEIIAEKQSFSTLSGLTTTVVTLEDLLSALDSGSKVAIWVLWAYVQAVNVWTLENVMLSFIEEVELEKATAPVGSISWYVDQVKLWQYGDILQINNTTYKPFYPTVNVDNQLVGSATGIVDEGKLIIKVRRKDTDILSVDEYNSLESYINKIKYAGTSVQIRNVESDKLKLYFDIIYDPQTELSVIKSNVESTINEYLQNLEFDSRFKTNELVDRLQLLTGVLDARWTQLEGRRDVDIDFTPFTWEYDSFAGYSIVEPTTPLADTITYISKTN